MGLFGPPNVSRLKAKRDIKGLLTALGYKKDPALRREAALALAEVLKPLPPDQKINLSNQLVAALDDSDYAVTVGVVHALAAVGYPAILTLITALRAPQERLREGAARALGRIGAEIAESAYLRLPIDPLIGALKDQSLTVRRAAAWALGRVGQRLDSSQRSLPVENLVLTLRDPAPEVREMAAASLGRLGEGRAIQPLILALEDGITSVRRTAAEALEALGWHPNSPAEQAAYYVAIQHWERAAAVGPDAAPALNRALQDRDSTVRKQAAHALGKVGSARVIQPLIQALQDPDHQVRRAAAESLEQAGAPQAVEALLSALRGSSREVKPAIARALGHSGDERAISALITAVKSRDVYLVEAAGHSLEKIGAPAVPFLIHLLREPVTDTREHAAAILTNIGAPSVIPLIDSLQNASSPINELSAKILGRIRDPRALRPLINALDHEELAGTASLALGKLADPRAVPRLLDMLASQTESVRQAAAIALGNIGDPRALDSLLQLLKSDESATRQEAGKALLQMYRAGKLDAAQKRRILAQQERIDEKHVNHENQVDNVHSSDESYHLDTGNGLEFK
jgi:HEAT repeat protein